MFFRVKNTNHLYSFTAFFFEGGGGVLEGGGAKMRFAPPPPHPLSAPMLEGSAKHAKEKEKGYKEEINIIII